MLMDNRDNSNSNIAINCHNNNDICDVNRVTNTNNYVHGNTIMRLSMLIILSPYK